MPLEIKGAPTEFRIWRAGDNPTDRQVTRFTQRSADALLVQQAVRGNLFSIDVDHMSLSEFAPPENHKAAGWHRLEVRDGELWAVDVQWVPWAEAGLESDPPEWRYISPAYDIDSMTGEVTRYLNTALTNNPATWHVTQLASATTEGEMRKKIEAAIAALSAFAGGDSPEATAIKNACAVLQSILGDAMKEEEPAPKEEAPPEEEEKPTPEKEEPEMEDGCNPKADATLLATIQALKVQLDAMKAEQAKAREKEERVALLASRPDFAKEVRDSLASASIEQVRWAVKTLPRTASLPEVRFTQPGDAMGDDHWRSLDAADVANTKMDQLMGLAHPHGEVRMEGTRLLFPALTPAEARALAAKKAGAK